MPRAPPDNHFTNKERLRMLESKMATLRQENAVQAVTIQSLGEQVKSYLTITDAEEKLCAELNNEFDLLKHEFSQLLCTQNQWAALDRKVTDLNVRITALEAQLSNSSSLNLERDRSQPQIKDEVKDEEVE